MPKEKRKRGRREEEKRKRADGNLEDSAASTKRPRLEYNGYGDDSAEIQPLYAEQEEYRSYSQHGPQELQFYGLLDEQEQAYFRQADSTLDLNQFADSEEKDLFLNNLWKEVIGKELKIAKSQSCSRLMERLIAASSSIQLKALWLKFNTHFLDLFQHRFASHCCEALFRRAATFIASERSASADHVAVAGLEVGGEETPSIENLFLGCVKELDGNFGYLMTDRFASHPLRVLLVVLSGLPLENTETRSLLQSKKKEHNVASSSDITLEGRVVLESFQAAIEEIISGSTANIDTSSLRALATHPVANPVLQLLLTISLTRSSKGTALKDPQSLFRLLIPEDPPEEGTESAAFINHLLYDPIGSRLLEVIITHAPGKTFKTLFRSLFKSKLPTLSRNETASFVVAKILARLSTADLESTLPELCTAIPTLIRRSRTHVIRILVTRCQVRSISATPIAAALERAYTTTNPDLRQMLDLSSQPDSNMSVERQKLLHETSTTKSTHLDNSLLLQTLLHTPGPLRAFATAAVLATDISTLKEISIDRTSSRVLQAALTPPSSPATADDIKFLRLLIPPFLPHIVEMATHPVASHVVDALWSATSSTGLKFLREQIATELTKGEREVKGSVAGKAVWRNWNMDVFKNRRRDWPSVTGTKDGGEGSGMGREKTGIELARERHAQKRAKGAQLLKGGGEHGGTARRRGFSGSQAVAQRA